MNNLLIIHYARRMVSFMIEIDTRAQIINAAETRFNQYGYNKTTMAEIARDCDMSAANLYRYFENKLDIAAALASQCLVEKERELEAIIANDSLTSAEKLQAFILYVLRYTYHHFDERPRLSELIEAMTIQRPDVVKSHRQSKLLLLRQLLEQSELNGEFCFADIDDTAEAINIAITAFYLPTVMSMYSLAEFEYKAKSLCNLLLNGLSVRDNARNDL